MGKTCSLTYQITLEQIRLHRASLIAAALLTLVATTLVVLIPLLFQFLVDEAITSQDMTVIAATLAGMVLLLSIIGIW